MNAPRKLFTIDEADWKRLLDLSLEAHRTPAFGLSSAQVLSGNDFASMARRRVSDLWDELGRKYGFIAPSVEPGDEKMRTVSAIPSAEGAR